MDIGSYTAQSAGESDSPIGITGALLQPLDPAWPRAERLGWWIFDAVVFFASLAGLIVLWINDGGEVWAKLILTAVWFLVIGSLLWATLAYPAAAYRRAAIAVGDLGIEYRRGVWWRKTTIIPRSRVQHTDVTQGPLMRRFGLGKLVIHTAGTRNAVVEIHGLSFADAERIRDLLLDRSRTATAAPAAPDEMKPTSNSEEADGV